LKIAIENYNDDIKLNFDQIEIQVNSCNSNQIKMYNTDLILYCENPSCKSSCPVGKSAYCKPYYESNINDINQNICLCFSGYYGTNCQNKILIDYRYAFKFFFFFFFFFFNFRVF